MFILLNATLADYLLVPIYWDCDLVSVEMSSNTVRDILVISPTSGIYSIGFS